MARRLSRPRRTKLEDPKQAELDNAHGAELNAAEVMQEVDADEVRPELEEVGRVHELAGVEGAERDRQELRGHEFSQELESHSLDLATLNKDDRWGEAFPTMKDVHKNNQYNDASPDHRRPVRTARVDRYRDGETTEDDNEEGIAECECVDRKTPTAETPSSGWKRFVSDSAKKDAPDREHVSG
ncbi:hypothetical protein MMC27_007394 [Xylographa pallens]|nr:hypothetical protein [Xylographa pallens]